MTRKRGEDRKAEERLRPRNATGLTGNILGDYLVGDLAPEEAGR